MTLDMFPFLLYKAVILSIVIRNGKIGWKLLVRRLPQNTSNVNIESTGKSKQLYNLCD